MAELALHSAAAVTERLLPRVMRTQYRIDDLQDTYFDHESPLDFASIDFAPAYEAAPSLPTHEPDDIIDSNTVLTDGTTECHDARRHLAGVLK